MKEKEILQLLLSYLNKVLLELSNCLSKYPHFYRAKILLKHVIENIVENIEHDHLVDAIRDLRLILEIIVQTTYLHMKHRGDQKAIEHELSRREKTASIFNAKMITDIPGLHGVVKKDILKLYLKLAEYTHPTSKLLEVLTTKDLLKLQELALKTIDYTTYLLLVLCGKNYLDNKLVHEARKYNLERTSKYLGK